VSTQETVTVQKLDEALARLPASPVTGEDIEARAALMARRIELDQSARAAAANSRPQPRGGLVVNVPVNVGTTHLYGRGGRVACSRVAEDGRVVIDLFQDEFKRLLGDRMYGQAWHDANPEALRRLVEIS
jgi:hypothetical protein